MAKSKEYELAIKIAGEIEKSFYNSTKLTKSELAAIAKEASTTSKSISSTFSSGLKDAAPAFEKIEGAGRAAFEAIATAATVAATAIAAGLAASVAVGASFESQMSTVQAISGASTNDMSKLNDLAKELGSSTKFTATEVGEAMEYMAMAGWKTQDMLNGMAGVLNLAAASGEDLATTSDIVTDAMTAFGLGADQVDHFADVLAATATNSNTTVSMMGESFSYAASLAGAMGYSIEDVSTAIGLMANSGIKASQAGTALRKIFTETTNGATVSSQALGEYAIQTQNADGSMKDLKDIIVDMRYAFSNMTEAEKAQNAEAIAGKTGMSGLLAIVNASEADYNKLTGAIYNCTGAAQQMADIRIDNLSGDVTIMKSAMEGLGIEIYEGLNEPLRAGVQYATQLVGQFNSNIKNSGILDKIESKVPTAVRKMGELTDAAKRFASPFFAIGGWLIDHPGVIVGAVASLGTAIVTYKVASGIVSIVTAFGALGPVGWSIIGMAGVVGVIAGIGTATKKAANDAKKANFAKHFGNISLSLSELEQVAGYIVSNDYLGQLSESMSELAKLDDVQKSIDDSVASINKMNWKVSIGMQLSADEQESYASEISNYVSQCQQYVTDKQYAVSLAVGVLTDDDLEGHNMVTEVNKFYADKQEQLSALGTKLNDAITNAFQDGLLDMDEVKEITELQSQMAKIQSAVAGSNFEAELDLLQLKYDGGELDAESFQNLKAEIQKQVDAATTNYDDAYTLSVSNAKVMLEDGAIDSTQYDAMVAEYKENYLEQVGDLQLKATSFQLDTIQQQYADEIAKASPELQEKVSSVLNEAFSGDYTEAWKETPAIMWQKIMDELENASSLDGSTQAAISSLLKTLEPQADKLESLAQQYRDAGQAIPEELQKGLNDYEKLEALTNDTDAMFSTIGDTLSNNTEYSEVLKQLQAQGNAIPDEIAKAINDNQAAVKTATNGLYQGVKTDISTMFSSGFDVEAQVRLKLNPVYDTNGDLTGPYSNEYIQSSLGIGGHADGGIFNQPHLAWFSEEGPEAAIPIDDSQNARDLWRETGRLLNMPEMQQQREQASIIQTSNSGTSNVIDMQSIIESWKDAGKFINDSNNDQSIVNAMESWKENGKLKSLNKEDSISGLAESAKTNSVDNSRSEVNNKEGNIIYSPTIQFYGSASSRDELDEALSLSQERFEEMMEQYNKDKGRRKFG